MAARRRDRRSFETDAGPGGMIFAVGPNENADRLITLHRRLGHSRHILQMDLGDVEQREVLEAIELLGTKVAAQVRQELAGDDGARG